MIVQMNITTAQSSQFRSYSFGYAFQSFTSRYLKLWLFKNIFDRNFPQEFKVVASKCTHFFNTLSLVPLDSHERNHYANWCISCELRWICVCWPKDKIISTLCHSPPNCANLLYMKTKQSSTQVSRHLSYAQIRIYKCNVHCNIMAPTPRGGGGGHFQKGWACCTFIPLTNQVRELYRKLRTRFFPPRFMAQARSVRAINRRGKNQDP